MPVATSDGFPFKRHAAFLDPERAGVVDVYAEYRLRAGGDDASPGDWRPARGLYPPPSGTDDPVWEVVVPTESSDSEARGYAVRLHFLMADGSVRTADTVLLPSEAIDAAAWCEKP